MICVTDIASLTKVWHSCQWHSPDLPKYFWRMPILDWSRLERRPGDLWSKYSVRKSEKIKKSLPGHSVFEDFEVFPQVIHCDFTELWTLRNAYLSFSWSGHAADPCPWPVPRVSLACFFLVFLTCLTDFCGFDGQAFDGLKCSWQPLAVPFGHNRVYLNPPWSQLDSWLEKARWDGFHLLNVVAFFASKITWACVRQQ